MNEAGQREEFERVFNSYGVASSALT